jgi:hypothetical protein
MSGMYPYQPPEDGLPPQEVRFTELRAEPWPDNSHRVRIHLQITAFLERPNIEVIILGPDGKKDSSIDIIETIDERMTFTIHLKGDQAIGTFTAEASLYYPDHGVVDKKSISFEAAEQTP